MSDTSLINEEGGEMDRQLWRMESAAQTLGVSHWALRLWVRQGKVASVKVGRLRLIPKTEIDRITKEGMPRQEFPKAA